MKNKIFYQSKRYNKFISNENEYSQDEGIPIILSQPNLAKCQSFENVIYFYNEIDTKSIFDLNYQIKILSSDLTSREINENIPGSSRIFLHIMSSGGDIFAGFSAMDEILNCKIPITTICDGECSSAATFIFLAGKERWMKKHSYFLIHQLSSNIWGKFEEIKDHMQNTERIMNDIKNIYKEMTNIPDNILEAILKRDIYLSPQECLEYGIIDRII